MNINSVASGAADVTYTKPEIRLLGQSAQEGGAPEGQNKAAEQVSLPGRKIDEEQIMAALKLANKNLEVSDRYIEREVHEKTHAVMYKLKDRRTGEVIAEFPPKKIQDMVAKMWELAGLFVDEKA